MSKERNFNLQTATQRGRMVDAVLRLPSIKGDMLQPYGGVLSIVVPGFDEGTSVFDSVEVFETTPYMSASEIMATIRGNAQRLLQPSVNFENEGLDLSITPGDSRLISNMEATGQDGDYSNLANELGKDFPSMDKVIDEAEEVDRNFMLEMQRILNAFQSFQSSRKDLVHQNPDLISLRIQSLEPMKKAYGATSRQYADASRIVRSVCLKIKQRFQDAYENPTVVIIATVPHNFNRPPNKRLLVERAPSDNSTLPPGVTDVSATFQLMFWTTILLIVIISMACSFLYNAGNLENGGIPAGVQSMPKRD
ncbi:hypothetical protein BZG36_04072 [Bifiguratus adelaidae]|uniref:Renin receptor N-terminal domain-containing protein n=1 Tax=Bifiguratus adelaidae TaxID=1938954 RepID=A0A261XY59_9FUNG|nr:hypothetical protein BZG36_04072 [Bifiguratus adelaidae]